MSTPLRLLAVFAHPDDETLGTGGTLARYGAEGVETYLVTATRGERGWSGPEEESPGLEAMGQLRERELRAAAEALRLREVSFLDYVDGELDQADAPEVIGKIVSHVRRIRPQVVITFGPDGGYGHTDHIAISQLATSAVVCAADATYRDPSGGEPYRVAKLYYKVWTREEQELYARLFGQIVMTFDGVERTGVPWEPWQITTRVDARDYWRTTWEAVSCHRSQLPMYDRLRALPEETHRRLWGDQGYYRAYSAVNGGRLLETDLFAGLR